MVEVVMDVRLDSGLMATDNDHRLLFLQRWLVYGRRLMGVEGTRRRQGWRRAVASWKGDGARRSVDWATDWRPLHGHCRDGSTDRLDVDRLSIDEVVRGEVFAFCVQLTLYSSIIVISNIHN